MPDADQLRALLHSLRLLGHAPVERVADHLLLRRVDHPFDRPAPHLDAVVLALQSASDHGYVVERGGQFPGWSLTSAGRAHGEALLAAEADELGVRGLIERQYSSFTAINGRFLALCTDWQLRPAGDGRLITNDHLDEAWDARVLADLVEIHEQVVPIVDDLGRPLERFSAYRPRLHSALELVLAGDHDWFTRPIIDSYHTVWFELHEDLLGTLGLDRSGER